MAVPLSEQLAAALEPLHAHGLSLAQREGHVDIAEWLGPQGLYRARSTAHPLN